MSAEPAAGPDSGPELGPYGRRADAERNREAVLDGAARLLAERPGIGMAEIARAAGLGRATVYRHFPTRVDLLAAIDARAVAETERAIAASRLDEGEAADALHRLIAALLEIGDRYRFLLAEGTAALVDERGEERERRLSAPLLAFIERAQASGELSAELSPRWMLAVFGAVVVTALREIDAGRLDRDGAPGVVTATLLRGLARA